MFAVRIVTADYYMTSPIKDLDVCYSEFRESDVKRVPVVRIFGATPAGQKTCLHLHGIFPYIYVPYDGYGQQPERYLRQVAFSIDRALNASMGNPSSSAQHVFKVALVSGMPFYGYHAKEKAFMKIYLYNPQMVKRVCELLQGGAVMNKSYQPHEAHIPYLLQLFIDYNLYGMNLVNLGVNSLCASRGESVTPSLICPPPPERVFCRPSHCATQSPDGVSVLVLSVAARRHMQQAVRRCRPCRRAGPALVPFSPSLGQTLLSGLLTIATGGPRAGQMLLLYHFPFPGGSGQPLLLASPLDDRVSPQRMLRPRAGRDGSPGCRGSSGLWKSPCTSRLAADSTLGGSSVRWEEDAIPSSLVLEDVEKQSTCELEVDAVAADILNRLEIETQIGRNPGLQAIWEDEKQRRREKSESSQIQQPESQDRGSVASTESERVFMKRFREILKENEFSVTQSGSAGEGDESEMFPVELSLHPDVLSPEALHCTPANLVEVHKDTQTDTKRHSGKDSEVAIVDEEAILSLLESSQTFLPVSQRIVQSSLLDGSQDHAMVDLLAGLEDDGYQGDLPRKAPQQQLSGSSNCVYNSDDEEAGPELERQDTELSMMMSQRWDSDIPEHSSRRRLSMKDMNDSSSEEQQESSDEEMDWSGNNSLFANLSIPQLDGAADENSDSSLTDKGSRTHSSLTATDKILGKRNPFPSETVHMELPSSAKILLECKHPEHRQALSHDTEDPTDKHFLSKGTISQESKADSAGLKMNKESPYIQPVKHPIPCSIANKTDLSQMGADKMDVHPLYTYEKKAISHNKPDPDGLPFGNGKITQSRKKYSSIKNVEKNRLSILQNHRSFSLCYSELRNCPTKADLELSQKEGKSPLQRNLNPAPSPMEEDDPMAPQKGEMGRSNEEGDVGELKIRYEDYQENKTERTIVAQQEAHYKFFPSVILSNCLNRPAKKCGSNKPADGSGKPELEKRRSRLKLGKKKAGAASQKSKVVALESPGPESQEGAAFTSIKPACQKSEEKEKPETGPLEQIPDVPSACDPAEPSVEERLTAPTDPPSKVGHSKPSGPPGSKYTLRAKRKMSYDSEDGEVSGPSHQTKPALTLRGNYVLSGHEYKYQKRRKMSKKEPPIIIKYIIINRFKGQKNMLVKMAKLHISGNWYRDFGQRGSQQRSHKQIQKGDSDKPKKSKGQGCLYEFGRRNCQEREHEKENHWWDTEEEKERSRDYRELKPRRCTRNRQRLFTSASPQERERPPLSETPSGLAVLKELLQKRQQKVSEGAGMSASTPATAGPINSAPNPTSKPTKAKRAPSSTPRKPRAPKMQTPKEKKPRSRKGKNDKQEEPIKLEPPQSDDSPVFLSDPGFDSCYSIEDSLSPELPHNYNFDINTVGQTEFCGLYTGSQFVLADKNLPQTFLSDVIQEPVPALARGLDNMPERVLGVGEELQHGAEWHRMSSVSPDLFDKSPEAREGLPTHLSASLLDSDSGQELAAARIMRSREWGSSLSKAHGLSHFQGFHCERRDLLFSFDPFLPLPLNSTSFADILGSSSVDLMEGNDALTTTTPSSSPRSVSSLSQVKMGSQSQRGVGGAHILKPLMSPPSRDEILTTLLDLDLSEATYQEPFCSNPSDAGKPREIGGRRLVLETRLAKELAEFSGEFSLEGLQLWKTAFSAMTRPASPSAPGAGCVEATKGRPDLSPVSASDRKVVLLPCKSAPSRERVQLWLQARREFEQPQREQADAIEERAQLDWDGRQRVDGSLVSDEKSETAHDQIETSTIQAVKEKGLDICPAEGPKSPGCPGEPRTQHAVDTNARDDEEEDEDSLVLPPWQQTVWASPAGGGGAVKGSTQELVSPRLASPNNQPCTSPERRRDKEFLSPSPFSPTTQPGEVSRPFLLHSTPINRRWKSKGDPEPVYSPPTAEDAESISPRAQQRRGGHTDALRRVLLTTQMKNQFAALNVPKKDNSQIEGPSISNTYGFRVSMQNLQDAKALHEVQYLTLMSMELHARTRRDLDPDPEFDPICALFYCLRSDAPLPSSDKAQLTGAIVVDKDCHSYGQGSRSTAPLLVRSGISGLQVTYAIDEKHLFQEMTSIMRRFDPDILIGYEVQMHSWGYLLQRASALGVDLCQQLSRVPGDSKENRFLAERDEYGADTMTEINIVGRIVINLWRIMKTEATLTTYSFENVAFHILHQRFPLYSPRTLSDWFDHTTHLYRWKMVDHYVSRVCGTMQLLQQNDIIGRTSELARVFGIQFYHVLTRGSQYRVESMMLRIAKPMNYIPVTPSAQQRAQQRAPQCVPLIMEPESRFYSNSVVVLDFQSLYPSIVIAYNYCFSTCLGHVESLGTHDEFKFGCTSLRVPPDLLYQLRNDITVSPNGIAFVKSSVRQGVLPSMLEEILKTRIMVKQSMKAYKHDRALTRLLHARQLGLKLIANVTFGYTAANFSGRMPSVEVGDSIVHKARETLERAIKLVNDTKKWGAHVVYGDTDSMFVLLKGATKEQAFKIGNEIAEAVTATNPKPVKLKFEKVYLPCVLQTKKRYVGYMYESLDQKDPVFDAKGIETVRRDGCPAVSKILERSIKLLFETRDVSQVKQYVQRQCMKVLEAKASMQDLTFAKEYRGSDSYRPGACVPALEITRRMLAHDRRLEPRVGERVPYVIVYGMPGVPLIQLVRRPLEVLQDPSLRLNATYYITKQILPPLGRIFSLIGVDTFGWYQELPRIQKAYSTASTGGDGAQGHHLSLGVCGRCRAEPQRVAVTLHQELRLWESQQEQLLKICRSCCGGAERQVQCVSLDCPVMYKLSRVTRQLAKGPYLRQLLEQF
ncbi:hypothetical protein AAFF_G00179060 [Aldrovandia affinis]|uniref:DNA polymerase zeta catalytic subunit n=1 Tax=Aldrovandia affinis TaxID=143900 RepID=A0AAD7RKQ1_9TELE|nr:hypothetical protein AAFF_G00179060 [Aldrovandia affinis]